MLAAVDPIPIVLAFLGSSLPTMATGAYVSLLGIRGIGRASYPLTEKRQLTGLSARLAAGVVLFFGLLLILCGLATMVFCLYRLHQLLTD